MTIRFCKGDNARDTLVCARDDGTSTWSKLTDQFAYHDIVHYVVETALGFHNAFYGLIEKGWDIAAFTEIDAVTGKRPELPPEAMQTEGLVLILQSQSGNGAANEEILALLEMACVSNGVSVACVTIEQLNTMRSRIAILWDEWRQVPPGGELVRLFP